MNCFDFYLIVFQKVKFLSFVHRSVLSLLFVLLLVFLRKLDQDLDDLYEELEKVHEEDHGVLWHILEASLSSLDDELCVEDNVEASNEQSGHGVNQAELSTESGVSEQPGQSSVPEHAAGHGDDDSAEEEEGSSLAEEGDGSEGQEHDGGIGYGLNEDHWLELSQMVDQRSNKVAHAEAEGFQVSKPE